jgi:hypothetical protein
LKNEENSQPVRRERQAGNQKMKKQSTKRARKASWKSKNRENSQPRGRERQAGNQKNEKTVNQEGEKGKLEIKK